MCEYLDRIISQGEARGEEKGIKATNERVAKDMLNDNMPLPLIIKFSKLTEEAITALADKLGLKVNREGT